MRRIKWNWIYIFKRQTNTARQRERERKKTVKPCTNQQSNKLIWTDWIQLRRYKNVMPTMNLIQRQWEHSKSVSVRVSEPSIWNTKCWNSRRVCMVICNCWVWWLEQRLFSHPLRNESETYRNRCWLWLQWRWQHTHTVKSRGNTDKSQTNDFHFSPPFSNRICSMQQFCRWDTIYILVFAIAIRCQSIFWVCMYVRIWNGARCYYYYHKIYHLSVTHWLTCIALYMCVPVLIKYLPNTFIFIFFYRFSPFFSYFGLKTAWLSL